MRSTTLRAPLVVLCLALATATPTARAQGAAAFGAIYDRQDALRTSAQRAAETARRLERAGDTAAAVAQYRAVATRAAALRTAEDRAGLPPMPNEALLLGTALLEVGRLDAASGRDREAADAFDGAQGALLDAVRREQANRRLPIQYRVLVDARPAIFTALGEVYAYQGQYAIARGYYQDALRLAPKTTRARDGLGYLDIIERKRSPAQVRSAGTPVPRWVSNFVGSEEGQTALKAGVTMLATRLFGAYGAIATPFLLYVAKQLGASPRSSSAR